MLTDLQLGHEFGVLLEVKCEERNWACVVAYTLGKYDDLPGKGLRTEVSTNFFEELWQLGFQIWEVPALSNHITGPTLVGMSGR